MRISKNQLKGVASNYSTGLKQSIDIRNDYKYFVQEILTNPFVVVISLIFSTVIIQVIPALSLPLLLINIVLFIFHRRNQKPDIPNRLPIYVKNWWGITEKIRLMKSVADGVTFVGNLRHSKNQEVWNSKAQELKHKMDNTGTGGGKTTSILGGLIPAFGLSGQTTLTEAKGDANIARQYINLAREFCLDDDIHITTFATSNAPKEKGYKRSHSTNLHTGNDAAATNEIILGLLPSSNGQNSVFVQRATVLGKIANELVYERAANSDDGYRVTLKAMRKMLNLHELKNSLNTPWLKSDSLRAEVIYYLKDLQVDTGDTNKDANEKSIEQHMYAQMYFTKGLSTLTDTFGFIFNKQYGDYIWSDILNRKRHIYQLIPAIDKSISELEYVAKIHAQLILNAVKTFLDPRIQGRSHEINQLEHVDILSKLILDEFTFIIDPSVPTWIAQVRSMGISVSIYFQSLELTESKDKEVMIAIQNISGILNVGQTNDEKAREIVIKAAGKIQVARLKHVERDGSKYRVSKTLDLNMVNAFEHDDITQQTYGQSHTVIIGEKNKETGNNLAMRLQLFYLGDEPFEKLKSNDDIVLNHFIEHTNRVRPRTKVIKLANIKKKTNHHETLSTPKVITPDNIDTSLIDAAIKQSNTKDTKDTLKTTTKTKQKQKPKKAKPKIKKNYNIDQLDLFSFEDEIEGILTKVTSQPSENNSSNISIENHFIHPNTTSVSNTSNMQEYYELTDELSDKNQKPTRTETTQQLIENPTTLLTEQEFIKSLPKEIQSNINGDITAQEYQTIWNMLSNKSMSNDNYNYLSNELDILKSDTLAILDIMGTQKNNDTYITNYSDYESSDIDDFIDFSD